jgi:hypothetical protein
MSCNTPYKCPMPQPNTPLQAWARALAALCLAWLCACGGLQANSTPAPPVELTRELEKPVLAGSGRLRWLGIPVYDVSLWTAPQFVSERFGAHAFALEIRYARTISGSTLADTSLKQMQALDAQPVARQTEWRQALTGAFPDVKPGDRLTGIHVPDKGLRLYFNGQLHKAIDDPLLSQIFFAIWLSPATQEPRLRAQLLGLGS